MLAQVDPRTFAQSIFLLIGALILLGLLSFALLAAIVGLRILLWRRRVRRAQREYRERTFLPDGRPYPPIAQGLCDACGRVANVYHLQHGERYCPACFTTRWKEPDERRPDDRDEAVSAERTTVAERS